MLKRKEDGKIINFLCQKCNSIIFFSLGTYPFFYAKNILLRFHVSALLFAKSFLRKVIPIPPHNYHSKNRTEKCDTFCCFMPYFYTSYFREKIGMCCTTIWCRIYITFVKKETITGQATVRTFFAKSAENANSPLH